MKSLTVVTLTLAALSESAALPKGDVVKRDANAWIGKPTCGWFWPCPEEEHKELEKEGFQGLQGWWKVRIYFAQRQPQIACSLTTRQHWGKGWHPEHHHKHKHHHQWEEEHPGKHHGWPHPHGYPKHHDHDDHDDPTGHGKPPAYPPAGYPEASSADPIFSSAAPVYGSAAPVYSSAAPVPSSPSSPVLPECWSFCFNKFGNPSEEELCGNEAVQDCICNHCEKADDKAYKAWIKDYCVAPKPSSSGASPVYASSSSSSYAAPVYASSSSSYAAPVYASSSSSYWASNTVVPYPSWSSATVGPWSSSATVVYPSSSSATVRKSSEIPRSSSTSRKSE